MANFIVTTNLDVVDENDGVLSLREAIAQANASGGVDTISFDNAVFTGGDDSLIRLTQGQLTATEAFVLDGSDATDLVITGDASGDDALLAGTNITGVDGTSASELDDNSRVFDITATGGTTVISDVTITGGHTNAEGEDGGAIRTAAAIRIENSTLAGNSTAGDGSFGGAVSADGNATIVDSTLTGNETSGRDGRGGALSSDGDVLVVRSEFSNNSTSGVEGDGGAIRGNGDGGITIISSTFSDNRTFGSGSSGGAWNSRHGDTFLVNSTVVDNRTFNASGSPGGGFFSNAGAHITNSTITGNTAADGAGGVGVSGTATFTNSIVLGNDSSAGSDDEFTANGATFQGVNIIGEGTDTDASDGVINANAEDVFAQTSTSAGTTSGVEEDNGGPTETVALNGDADNPALDAGNSTASIGTTLDEAALGVDINGDGDMTDVIDGIDDFATDQNGDSRDADLPGSDNGGTIDLGAVEVTPIVVTTTEDVVDADDGVLSLREAIALANEREGVDTITFDAGLAASDDDAVIFRLTEGELTVTEAFTLDGSAIKRLVISGDANGDDATFGIDGVPTSIPNFEALGESGTSQTLDDNSRLFNIQSSEGVVTFANVVLTGGHTSEDGASGGAVFSNSDLLFVNQAFVSGNATSGDNAHGGGIFSTGNVTFEDDSGALFNATFGGGSQGGAVAQEGDFNGDRAVIAANATLGAQASGGGVAALNDGAITLLGSAVFANQTAGFLADGGALFSGGTIIVSDGSVVFQNSTNGFRADGGAIHGEDVVITNGVAVTDNSTNGDNTAGGALRANGAITIQDSTFADNTISGEFGQGGAIAVVDGGTIVNATFFGNGVDGLFARGGAIFSFSTANDLVIENSTFTGNFATGENGEGGAIQSNQLVTIRDSILLGNFATVSAANEIGINFFAGGLTFEGTSIIGNGVQEPSDDGDVQVELPANVISARAEDVFAQIVDNNGISAGALNDVDPFAAFAGGLPFEIPLVELLASLANPALDAGTSTGADAQGTDPVDIEGIGDGTPRDLGAFEVSEIEGLIQGTELDDDPLEGTNADDEILGLGGNDVILALDGDDVVAGGSGDDDISGQLGNDALIGGTGNDVLRGGNGNDRLSGGLGDDILAGGGGSDTAVFVGSIDDYDIVKTGANAWTVTDLDPLNGNGFDTLTGIEFIRFDDTADLDLTTFTDTVGQTENTASAIAVGETVTGTIDAAGDIDLFVFDAPTDAGQRYIVTISGISTGGGTLTNPGGALEIFQPFTINEFLQAGDLVTNNERSFGDAGGGAIDSDGLGIRSGTAAERRSEDFIGAGVGTDSQFIITDASVDDGLTNFISVSALDGLETGTYTVTLEELIEDLPGSTPDSNGLGRINVGDTITEELEYGQDQDRYLINLEAGKTYVFDLEGVGADGGTLVDPAQSFGVPNSASFNFSFSDTDGGAGESAQLVVTVAQNGEYAINVFEDGADESGTYTLSVTETEDDFGGTRDFMGVIDETGTITGTFETLGDLDAFRLVDRFVEDTRYAAMIEAVGDHDQTPLFELGFASANAGIPVRTESGVTDGYLVFNSNVDEFIPVGVFARLNDDTEVLTDYVFTMVEASDTVDDTSNFVDLFDATSGQTVDTLGGNDVLIGSAFDDDLRGGDGSDGIEGGAGNDTITGGPGFDYLTGGNGADTFVFDQLVDSDVIRDFNVSGGDRIDLSALMDDRDFVALVLKDASAGKSGSSIVQTSASRSNGNSDFFTISAEQVDEDTVLTLTNRGAVTGPASEDVNISILLEDVLAAELSLFDFVTVPLSIGQD